MIYLPEGALIPESPESPDLDRDFPPLLLAWYGENARDLPWRRDRNPYAIWLSEIMAQQTRIAAVVPYYERFIKRFPTARELAEADEEEVLKTWQGLGYYSRARSLHQAARIVCGKYGGQLPADVSALRALPGVGDYTAGAIASIAFGLRAPAIDGNALRVVARLTADNADVTLPAFRRAAAARVASWMPDILSGSATETPAGSRCGDFTQAMMELGALICVPGKPACPRCPARGLCAAARLGCAESLPVLPARKEKRVQPVAVVLALDEEGRVLMRRRTQRLLRGMWEYILLEGEPDEAELPRLLAPYARAPRFAAALPGARHVFTHLIWQMRGFVFRAQCANPPEGYRWVARDEWEALPLPTALAPYSQWLTDYFTVISRLL